MQKNRKWIIPVLVAIASLIFAAFIYFETTRPQSQLEQVKDKLDTTEKRWQEANKLVEEKENRGENIDKLKKMLQKARELYLDAENKWMHGDYDEARTSVDESYEITVSAMEEIIPVPMPPYIVSILVAVIFVVVTTIVIILQKRRVKFVYGRSAGFKSFCSKNTTFFNLYKL